MVDQARHGNRWVRYLREHGAYDHTDNRARAVDGRMLRLSDVVRIRSTLCQKVPQPLKTASIWMLPHAGDLVISQLVFTPNFFE